jgi:hypothetical protein
MLEVPMDHWCHAFARTGTPTGLQHVLDYAIGGIHLKARSFKYN